MVAQENRPLAIGGNLRGLAQDVGDRKTILLGQRHVHARHQRKVEGHVAFVAVVALLFAKIQLGIFRPLVGFGQQHAVGVMGIDFGTDLLEHLVGLGQVLVVGAVAFDQVGNGIQAQAVDAHVEPVAHHRQHCLHDLWIVEIQVRLMGVEAVPEVLAGDRIPGPVGFLGVEKDDPGLGILVIGVGPHVEVSGTGTWLSLAGSLEPGVLVGGVIDH